MLIHARELTDLSIAIVERAGGASEAAKMVADRLVHANLTGHDSHGVGVLPGYVRGIKLGQLVASASAEVGSKRRSNEMISALITTPSESSRCPFVALLMFGLPGSRG